MLLRQVGAGRLHNRRSLFANGLFDLEAGKPIENAELLQRRLRAGAKACQDSAGLNCISALPPLLIRLICAPAIEKHRTAS